MSAELNNDKLPSAGSVEKVFEVGQRVFGRFEVLAQLGAGGMGQVYKVRDTNLDKTLALKVLHAHAREESSLVRFQNEAKTASRLVHPNIAKVYDFGLSEDGSPYMASEFIEGETLEQFLRAGPLPVNLFLSVFTDVAEALDCAHRNGIVHRDIKPGNIMLVERDDGLVDTKVVDFGLAKQFDATESGGEQAKTTALMGTPLYMSPEQCRGESASPRSDLYSLGCVMYESIAGTVPLVGEHVVATLFLHQFSEPQSLRTFAGEEFSSQLLATVEKLMAKNASARYATAGELVKVLENEISEIEKIVEARAAEEEASVHAHKESARHVQFGDFKWFQTGKSAFVTSAVILLVVAGLGFVAVIIFSTPADPGKPLSYPLYVDPVSGALNEMESEKGSKVVEKFEDSLARVSKSNVGKKLEDNYATEQISINGGVDSAKALQSNSRRSSLTEAQKAELLDATPEDRRRTLTGVRNEIKAGAKRFKLFVHGSLLDDDMQVFQNYQPVEEINAWSMPIGNESLKYLSGLKNLQVLNISETRISSMASLNGVDGLQHLLLENDEFDDSSIGTVLRFKSLEKLDLRGTAVTTAGLEKLVNMPNLYDVALTFPSEKIPLNSMLGFAREHQSCKFLGTSEVLLAFESAAQKALKAADYKKYLAIHDLMLNIMDQKTVTGSLPTDEFKFTVLQGCSAASVQLGDNVAAENYFKKELELSMRMHDFKYRRVAALSLLNFYNSNKNFVAAESVMKKWLDMCDKSEADMLTTYDGIRTLISYFDTNKQPEKGKVWAKRLMELKGVGPVRQAAARAQYAYSLHNTNQNKRATPIFKEAVSDLRRLVKEKRSDESAQALALALYQFSLSQFFLKDYDSALRLNEEAIKESQGSHGSIFILEGVVHERLSFMLGLRRAAEAAALKEQLAKISARREAVQRVQAAQAARKAKSAE